MFDIWQFHAIFSVPNNIQSHLSKSCFWWTFLLWLWLFLFLFLFHLAVLEELSLLKTVKRVTSYIFQITPSLLALRMTTARMTNHNIQWVPPSLRKEWQIHVLIRLQINPYPGVSLLSYYAFEYFPTTPDYITANAEILGSSAG